MRRSQPDCAITNRDIITGDDVTAAAADDVTSRPLPFRVRPEARQIWQQHTVGSMAALLQHRAPPHTGSDGASSRQKLRANRSQPRQNGAGRQPMRALPLNGVPQEGLGGSQSGSSMTSPLPVSPAFGSSPRRHIDLTHLPTDAAAVETIRGVKVISPRRRCEEIPSPTQGEHEGILSRLKESERIPSPREGSPRGSGGHVNRVNGEASFSQVQQDVHSSPHYQNEHLPAVASERRTVDPGGATHHATDDFLNAKGGSGGKFLSGTTNKGIASYGSGGGSMAAPPPLWASSDRAVRLQAPSESSESDPASSRREKIRDMIDNLRCSAPSDSISAARDVRDQMRRWRPPNNDVTSGSSVTSQPVTSRFSDETTQTFREQALERARAPYRTPAPSIASSRKFKSSETLRDGATGAATRHRNGVSDRSTQPRLLSRRKSQSVTKLPGTTADRDPSPMQRNPPPAEGNPLANLRDRNKLQALNNGPGVLLPARSGSVVDGEVANGTAQSAAVTDGQTGLAEGYGGVSEPHSDAASKVDFVLRNRRLASTQPRRYRSQPQLNEKTTAAPPAAAAAAGAAGASVPAGTLPRYLVKRREQWRREEEDRVRNAPDPACPPGHTRMPESERLETLSVLQENHQALLDQLRALPIAHTSHRIITQRADLENQLRKLEDGVRIFSRPKVFIKNES